MKRTAVFVLALALGADLVAQDTSQSQGVERKPHFFETGVDFWRTGRERETPHRVTSEDRPGNIPVEGQDVRRSIWAEPVRMPDGRYAIYLPPKAVLQFLEDPTPESLDGYLAWKKERAGKLKKALALLRERSAREQARASQRPEKSSPVLSAQPLSRSGGAVTSEATRRGRPAILPLAGASPVDNRPIEITYFHQHG